MNDSTKEVLKSIVADLEMTANETGHTVNSLKTTCKEVHSFLTLNDTDLENFKAVLSGLNAVTLGFEDLKKSDENIRITGFIQIAAGMGQIVGNAECPSIALFSTFVTKIVAYIDEQNNGDIGISKVIEQTFDKFVDEMMKDEFSGVFNMFRAAKNKLKLPPDSGGKEWYIGVEYLGKLFRKIKTLIDDAGKDKEGTNIAQRVINFISMYCIIGHLRISLLSQMLLRSQQMHHYNGYLEEIKKQQNDVMEVVRVITEPTVDTVVVRAIFNPSENREIAKCILFYELDFNPFSSLPNGFVNFLNNISGRRLNVPIVTFVPRKHPNLTASPNYLGIPEFHLKKITESFDRVYIFENGLHRDIIGNRIGEWKIIPLAEPKGCYVISEGGSGFFLREYRRWFDIIDSTIILEPGKPCGHALWKVVQKDGWNSFLTTVTESGPVRLFPYIE